MGNWLEGLSESRRFPSELDFLCSPNGIRTRVATLRGWCPRPLDDGAERQFQHADSAWISAVLGGKCNGPNLMGRHVSGFWDTDDRGVRHGSGQILRQRRPGRGAV